MRTALSLDLPQQGLISQTGIPCWSTILSSGRTMVGVDTLWHVYFYCLHRPHTLIEDAYM